MYDEGHADSVTVAAATTTNVFRKRIRNRRVSYSITNVGANPVFLVLSNTQTATAVNAGIELAVGATLLDSDSGGGVNPYHAWSGAISAYSTLGSTLSTMERVAAT